VKKNLGFVFFVLLTTAVYAQTLDSAIADAAAGISGRLPEGTTVVVLDFQSPTERLTNYVIDELNGKFVNIGKLKPVERRQLDAVRSELNFNMSGDVSDESAQRIGRMLGSQYMIMGSIEMIGAEYRIRFRAITVETASIVYTFSQNTKNDRVLETLLMGAAASLVDFTFQERITASALNLALGAGSFFIQKDTRGGGITAALEGLGIIGMVAGQLLYSSHYRESYSSINDSYYAYPFYLGLGAYLGGAVYGVIRAQTYHKPGSQVAVSPPNGLRLNLVSHDNKHPGLGISYAWSF
jgi:TolB-like protein